MTEITQADVDDAYQDGFNEGQSEATGAAGDLWDEMCAYLRSVNAMPKIGEMGEPGTFSANDLMEALRDHVSALRTRLERAEGALRDIVETCGVVNFSSHNQMREAVEGAMELAESAIAEGGGS